MIISEPVGGWGRFTNDLIDLALYKLRKRKGKSTADINNKSRNNSTELFCCSRNLLFSLPFPYIYLSYVGFCSHQLGSFLDRNRQLMFALHPPRIDLTTPEGNQPAGTKQSYYNETFGPCTG